MGTKTYSAGMSIDEVLANNAWVLEWTEQLGNGQLEFTYPGYKQRGAMRQHTFEGLQSWADSVRNIVGGIREREKREEAEKKRSEAALKSTGERGTSNAAGGSGPVHPVYDSLSETEVSLEDLLEEKRSAYSERLSTINSVIASLTRERATLQRNLDIVRKALSEYDHPQEDSGSDSEDRGGDKDSQGPSGSGGLRAEDDARSERGELGDSGGVSYSATVPDYGNQNGGVGSAYREVVTTFSPASN